MSLSASALIVIGLSAVTLSGCKSDTPTPAPADSGKKGASQGGDAQGQTSCVPLTNSAGKTDPKWKFFASGTNWWLAQGKNVPSNVEIAGSDEEPEGPECAVNCGSGWRQPNKGDMKNYPAGFDHYEATSGDPIKIFAQFLYLPDEADNVEETDNDSSVSDTNRQAGAAYFYDLKDAKLVRTYKARTGALVCIKK